MVRQNMVLKETVRLLAAENNPVEMRIHTRRSPKQAKAPAGRYVSRSDHADATETPRSITAGIFLPACPSAWSHQQCCHQNGSGHSRQEGRMVAVAGKAWDGSWTGREEGKAWSQACT